MITIYINDAPVYLSTDLNENLKSIAQKNSSAVFKKPSGKTMAEVTDSILSGVSKAAIFFGEDVDNLKKKYFKKFKIIEAAGGIVLNNDKEILFMFRRGKWDLPKGKVDEGEDLETCARREVEEETGAKDLQLKKKVGETYHTYELKGKLILKITHWFYFIAPDKMKLTPQTEEDITEVKWFSTRDIRIPVSNTYMNIKEILSEFFDTP